MGLNREYIGVSYIEIIQGECKAYMGVIGLYRTYRGVISGLYKG